MRESYDRSVAGTATSLNPMSGPLMAPKPQRNNSVESGRLAKRAAAGSLAEFELNADQPIGQPKTKMNRSYLQDLHKNWIESFSNSNTNPETKIQKIESASLVQTENMLNLQFRRLP